MGKKLAYFLAILVIILVAAAIYFINPFQKQAKAGLQVVIYDADASLFLDDQYLDKAPYINRTIRPGNYQLNIIPDNSELLPKDLSISLNPGTLTVVYWKPADTHERSSGLIYELEPIPNRQSGELQIITEPHEAIIYLGDRSQEFAPHIFKDLEPGDHTAQIFLPGYEDHEQKFSISAGYRLKITVKLAQIGPESLSGDIEEESPDNQQEEQLSEEPESTASSTLTVLPTNFFQEEKEVLRVRADSSIAGSSIGFVEVGNTFTYQEIRDGWYLITFIDAIDQQKKEGWVSGQFVEVTTQEESPLEENEEQIQEEKSIN